MPLQGKRRAPEAPEGENDRIARWVEKSLANLENPRREGSELWQSFMLRYGAAVAGVALAVGVRLLIDPLVGDHSRYAVLLLALVAIATYAGGKPASIALVLGLLSTDYFLIPPRGEFWPKGRDAYFELFLYAGAGLGIILVCGFMRASSLRVVGELHQAKKALSQAEERLTLTLSCSGIAIWSWDVAQNIIRGDENSSALFGLPRDVFPRTVEEFAALVHPGDRERVQWDLSASLERGTEYQTEFRVVWPDGTVRTLASRARIHYGETGRPLEFTGLSWDVSEHHQAEESLRLVNRKLSESVQELKRRQEQAAILSKMNDLLQACSSLKEAYEIVAQFCGHLFSTCAGVLYVFSASRNLVNGVATWNEPLVNEGEFEPDDCWALRRGQPHITGPGLIETPCRHLKGIPGRHACLPLMAQGTGLGILYLQKRDGAQNPEEFLSPEDRQFAGSVAENVAISLSNIHLQASLRGQSIRDPLTGLFNRRYLEESVERELHRLARREQPAGFAMLDLDHFKNFNDTFGHEGGDALLRAFGQFLREVLRKEDIACRYGGEEFCILFCESPLDDTVRAAERLRSGVSLLAVQNGGQHLGVVTVSIGIASYPANGNTLIELIGAADRALYQAKTDGRNRVVIAATTPIPQTDKGSHSPISR